MLIRFKPCWVVVVCSLAFAVSAQGQNLKWKLTPGTKLNYTSTQDSDTAMTVGGQTIMNKMSMGINTLWTVNQVDSQGTADITQSFTSIKFKLSGLGVNLDYDSASGTEPKDPIGKQIASSIKPLSQAKFNFKLSPRGEITDVKIPEESQKLLQGVQLGPQVGGALSPDSFVAMIKESVIPFPAEPVQKGSSWKHKSEVKAPPIGTMTNEVTMTYLGPAQSEGKQLDQIQVEVTSKLTADPANPLVQVSIKEQSEKGSLYFDSSAGRLSHSESTQNLKMDVSAAGQKFEQTVKTIKKASLAVADKK